MPRKPPKTVGRPVPVWPGGSAECPAGQTVSITLKAFAGGFLRWLRLLAFNTTGDGFPNANIAVTSIAIGTTKLFDSDTGASVEFWRDGGPESFNGFADPRIMWIAETDVLTITFQNHSDSDVYVVSALAGIYREVR